MAENKSQGRNGNINSTFNRGCAVPNEVKKLRGTYHPKNDKLLKAKRAAEEKGQAIAPIPIMDCSARDLITPASLVDDEAREEWARVIVPMAQVGIIKRSDLTIAEIYCDIHGEYMRMREAHRNMRNEVSSDGAPLKPIMPYSTYPLKLAKEVVKLLNMMGMTPVSRARVIAFTGNGQLPKDDDWEAILND